MKRNVFILMGTSKNPPFVQVAEIKSLYNRGFSYVRDVKAAVYRGALIVIFVMVSLAAFGSGKEEASDSGSSWVTEDSDDDLLPGVNPLEVKGNIIAAGSSTVYPLSERMVERFVEEGYSGLITVDSIGSGAGFERFTKGETDISNASRPIKSKEVDAALSIGRDPIEIRVGTDALAVVVNKSNTFIKDATIEQLFKIFSTAAVWREVDPSWPDKEIKRFIPGTDSGTFDFFVEEVFEKDAEPILSAANLQLSEDDNILVQGILGSPYAIGFFGYAYYAENRDKLNILNIEGIEPADATVDNNSYPLARPLFMYTTAGIMQEKPQVAAFVAFYLTYVNEEIKSVGYFPADEKALTGAKQKWLEAMEGWY